MKDKYLEDLAAIRSIMDRSSRFISLSGWSGVAAGLSAIAGAWLAFTHVFQQQHYWTYGPVNVSSESIASLLQIVLGTLTLAIGTAIYFTRQKARHHQLPAWNDASKKLLMQLAIPLVAGGLLCLLLLFKGLVGILPALTLIFYGLALVNASKYTLPEIRSLGLLEIVLGLIAIQFIEQSLLIWSIGFGALHIIYGVGIYLKYKL